MTYLLVGTKNEDTKDSKADAGKATKQVHIIFPQLHDYREIGGLILLCGAQTQCVWAKKMLAVLVYDRHCANVT